MTGRGDRRHHSERVKARWRRIIAGQRKRLLVRMPPAAPPPRFVPLEREAGVRAGHPRHFCQLCKGPRYRDRRAAEKHHPP